MRLFLTKKKEEELHERMKHFLRREDSLFEKHAKLLWQHKKDCHDKETLLIIEYLNELWKNLFHREMNFIYKRIGKKKYDKCIREFYTTKYENNFHSETKGKEGL